MEGAMSATVQAKKNETSAPASFGVAGMDQILHAGLPRNRMYLIQGDPGSGKTTLALQFLLEGVKRNEPGLYITLSETSEELSSVALSHGWDLSGVTTFELAAIEESLKLQNHQSVFPPGEVDLTQTTEKLLAICEETQPLRVVIDSCAELRLLAQNALRYRRQILAFKQYFAGRQCTVLLLDDRTSEIADLQLQSLAHGVIELEQRLPEYGSERRRLRIAKLRGVNFQGGYHDFHILSGGLVVHPRVSGETDFQPNEVKLFKSNIRDLDQLLGEGLERGTSTLLLGPAGSGKSTFALHYMNAAAEAGEKAVFYSFEEGPTTFFRRATSIGLDIAKHQKSGKIELTMMNPASLSSGAFTQHVKDAVEKNNASMVVIDSLNGYLNSVADEKFMSVYLRDLLNFLARRQVITLLVVAQHGMVGNMQSPIDVSYLADSVILFRYFEFQGHIRKAVSVLKKRGGAHETSIRELSIGPDGMKVGPPLETFHGVLTGVPQFRGDPASLSQSGSGSDDE